MTSYLAQQLWSVVSPVIFVLGTTGNILCILVLTRPESRTSTTARYLTALAVSDLIVLFTGLTRWWLIYAFDTDVRLYGDIGCRLHWFLMLASSETSSWILVAVTCEQILIIAWPHRVREICTSKSAIYVIICVHVIIYGANIHLLFGNGLSYAVSPSNASTVNSIIDISTTNISYDWNKYRTPLISDISQIGKIAHTNSLENNSMNDQTQRSTFEDNATTIDSKIYISTTNFFNDGNRYTNPLIGDISQIGQTAHSNSLENNSMDDQTKMSTFEDNTKIDAIMQEICGPLHNGQYTFFFKFVFPLIDLSLYFFIPAFILTVGKVIIIKQLANSRRLRKQMTSNSSVQRSSITVLLLTVNTLFILFTTPACVFFVGLKYWVDKDTGFTAAQEIGWCVVNLMMFLNHSLNFVSYLLSGTRFRRQFIRMCKKKPQRVSWFSSRTRENAPKQTVTSSQTTVSVIAHDVPMKDIVNNLAD